MNKFIMPTFWATVILFLIILAQMFIPAVRDLFRGSIFFLLPFAIFSLLGLILIFLAIKGGVVGKLKKFLLLTGISSAGIFVAIVLHNLIYALAIYFLGEDFWERSGMGDEPVFFILGLIVLPICFLIGLIGTIVLLIKQKT
jgi:hypothetical protein